MAEKELDIFPEPLRKALTVNTYPTQEDLRSDDWDSENNCSYSADGEKLLDADSISVAFCDGANKDATIKEMDKMTGFGILAVPFLNLSDST